MVEAIELTKVFGKLVAVDHVSFWVAEREISIQAFWVSLMSGWRKTNPSPLSLLFYTY
jgi:hypothetical protein